MSVIPESQRERARDSQSQPVRERGSIVVLADLQLSDFDHVFRQACQKVAELLLVLDVHGIELRRQYTVSIPGTSLSHWLAVSHRTHERHVRVAKTIPWLSLPLRHCLTLLVTHCALCIVLCIQCVSGVAIVLL